MRLCGAQLVASATSIRRRLGDESGIALVMALGTMLTLSMLLAG